MNIRPTSALLVLLTAALSSCGGGGGSGTSTTVSAGLKIFATAATHNGGFKNDNLLVGSTAMEKADSFCQTDAHRPDSGTYKAILVDGVSRDALTPLDWVLKPDTTYYQADNNVVIGTTTAAALFGQNLENDIHDSFGISGGNNANTSTAYTGFADPVSYTATSQNCGAWSDPTNAETAPYGISYGKDGSEWQAPGGQVCSLPSRIYCAEQ
jgi:trimeric autotransporter adhesin